MIRDAIGTKNEIVSILLKNFPREMDKLLATYDPIDLAVMDLSPLLKAYESFSDDFWKRTIADTKKTMGIIDFVKANLSPDGKKKLEAYEKTLLKSKMMYNSANRVATQAKKVYASLYQFAKKPQSNPCRDFVL